VLYWKGTYSHKPALALVGSRQATSYGLAVTKKLVPPLVKAGYTIISGGAIGVDTMVHEATLVASGTTIAVIGSGLLKPYPAVNKNLFQTIIEQGGTLMSSFPLTMGALPGNFPARNRIIAGLSDASVIIQAAARSGALITAHYALEQGKEVAAVPGPITDELSVGCNFLLAQGATVVCKAEDILAALGALPKIEPEQPRGNSSPTDSEINTSSPCGLIIQACQIAISFDMLLEKTGMSAEALHEHLFSLQCEGKVEQNFMGFWKASNNYSISL
jgi:DNA processing protein